MKKAITIGTMGKFASCAKDAFEIVKKAGFDGVELNVGCGSLIDLDTTDDEIKKIADTAKNVGIEIASVTGDTFFRYSLASADEESRETSNRYIKKEIDAAKICGADTILFVPGLVDASIAGRDEIVQYDVAYRRAQEGVRELIPYAKAAGVNLGVEYVWNKFLTSPADMCRFIDELNDDIVGAYFDVGNVMQNGYPEHWIKMLGSRIKRVHVKDFKNAVGNIAGFVPLLAGNVNYPAVMEALKEVGYDKWITSEVAPSNYYQEYGIYATALAMDYIIGNK